MIDFLTKMGGWEALREVGGDFSKMQGRERGRGYPVRIYIICCMFLWLYIWIVYDYINNKCMPCENMALLSHYIEICYIVARCSRLYPLSHNTTPQRPEQ